MHYIRQLFEGRQEEWVHLLFTRYGRGDFDGPVCEADVGKEVKFKGTVEYATAVGQLASSCGGEYQVEGGIYGKIDFRPILDAAAVEYDDKSKPKQGYYAAQLKGAIQSEVLTGLYGKMPHASVLLSFQGGKAKMKCKKKPPKPGGEKELEFFSGSMALSALPGLREEVFFGAGDFVKAKVEHRVIIDEVVIPAGMNSTDARLHAKRKGRLVRTLTVDGRETRSEHPFIA